MILLALFGAYLAGVHYQKYKDTKERAWLLLSVLECVAAGLFALDGLSYF